MIKPLNNLIKKTFTIFLILAMLLPILISLGHGQSAHAADDARQSFVICIDTSKSMLKYKEDISNLIETFDYIINCSYNKPIIHVMDFNTKVCIYGNPDEMDLISWVNDLDYQGYRTNIKKSLSELNLYLSEYHGLTEVTTVNEAREQNVGDMDAILQELRNTHFIYISDCENTAGKKDEDIIQGFNSLRYIRSYIIMFDSQKDIDDDAYSTIEVLDQVVFKNTTPTSEKMDDIYSYNFIDYVVTELGGKQNSAKYNRTDAMDQKYSQLLYILKKDEYDTKDSEAVLDTSVVQAEENTFIEPYVLFRSDKFKYDSLLVSIHETTREKLIYDDNLGQYDVYSFYFDKPRVSIAAEEKKYDRNEDIEFTVNMDKIISENNEMFDCELEYVLHNSSDMVQNREMLPWAETPFTYSEKYNIPDEYMCELMLYYQTKSFNDELTMNRTVLSYPFEFEVENKSPKEPEEKIERTFNTAEEKSIDLDKEFEDPENDILSYSIYESEDSWGIDNNILKLDTNLAGKYEVIIKATDSYGASIFTPVYFVVEDIPGQGNTLLWAIIIFSIIFGLVILFIKSRSK